MKRYTIIILSFIIFLMSCGTPAKISVTNNQDKNGKFSVDCIYNFYDISVDGSNNIYVPDKEEIYIFDNNGCKIGSIKETIEFCTNVDINENTLFIMDKGGQAIKSLTMDGKLIDEYDVIIPYSFKIERFGKYLFVLHQESGESDKRFITTLNLDKRVTEKIPLDNVISFSVHDDNTLYVSIETEKGFEILTYNYIYNEIIAQKVINSSVTDIYYNNEDDMIYFISNNCLKRIDKTLEQDEILFISEDNGIFYKVVVRHDICYIMDMHHSTIYTINKEISKEKTNTITILTSVPSFGDNPNIKKAVALLMKKTPGAQVRFSHIPGENYHAALKTKIMAREGEFDLFYLYSDECTFFIENNALQDLNVFNNITEKFDFLFEGAKDNSQIGGIFAGVPVRFTLNTWVMNIEIAEQICLEYPSKEWDWEDFLEYARRVNQDLDGDGKPDIYMLKSARKIPLFLEQYNTKYLNLLEGKASYNNSTFISLLKLWKKIWEEQLLVEIENNNRFLNISDDNNIIFKEKAITLLENNSSLVSPPKINGEDTLYPAIVDLLCINKYSSNKHLSANFLAEYLSSEVQTAYTGFIPTLYKDISKYEKPMSQRIKGFSNESNYNIYELMLNNSRRREHNSDLFFYIGNTIESYLDGGLTAEQAAKLIDEKAQLIVGE